MTEEQRVARVRRLVSAAKALLTLEVGLFVGARRIENALRRLGAEFETKQTMFSEFTHAVPMDIPLGSARLMWAPEAVLRTDLKLAQVEKRFRAKLLAECVVVIQRYD